MDNISMIKKAIKGNKRAFEKLMVQEQISFYKMAYLYVKNEDDALEVVHESVYKAYLSIGNLKEPSFFKTWMTRIVINAALDFLKRKNRVRDYEAELDESILVSDQPDLVNRMDLIDAVNKLDERFKTLIILRFYKDYSVRQMASVLNTPEGTIKSQLSRATNKLRCLMKEDLKNGQFEKTNG